MTPRLTAVKNGKALQIVATLAAGERFEIRLHSDRNRSISKMSDVSPNIPEGSPEKQVGRSDNRREMWFPVVDIEPEHDMEAVSVLSPSAETEYRWNTHLHSGREGESSLSGEVIARARSVEWWENSLVIDGSTTTLASFFLRVPARANPAGEYIRTIQLLTHDWHGDVSLWSSHPASPRQLAVVPVREPSPRTATAASDRLPEKGRKREGALSLAWLSQSLRDTVSYVLRSRNGRLESPTLDGLFLFYDLDARSFRCSHWVWTWGPAIKLLLEAADHGAIEALDTFSPARRIGEASLRFQSREGPLQGIASAWLEPTLASSSGYREKYSLADTSLLAGMGWIPLFEATGDVRFLDAAELLVKAIDKHLEQSTILPQDYLVDSRCWSPATLDEATFGLEGVAELYRITGSEQCRSIGWRYLDPIAARLTRPDGLWNRGWRWEDGSIIPSRFGTKDAAWVAMGLLAAHRMDLAGKYLAGAEQIAAHLLEEQEDIGAWAIFFNRPSAEVGFDEKGTGIWAFVLYRLFQLTSDERYLKSARRALRWCLEQQYAGHDVDAHGGIVGCSARSGIMYRRWFRLSCTYTSAFVGLATLAELRLQSAEDRKRLGSTSPTT